MADVKSGSEDFITRAMPVRSSCVNGGVVGRGQVLNFTDLAERDRDSKQGVPSAKLGKFNT